MAPNTVPPTLVPYAGSGSLKTVITSTVLMKDLEAIECDHHERWEIALARVATAAAFMKTAVPEREFPRNILSKLWNLFVAEVVRPFLSVLPNMIADVH